MSGPVPPPPVTGVKDVAATFFVSVVEATACAAVVALLTVKLNVAFAVPMIASVTVTV
jgi:hypothetical protein